MGLALGQHGDTQPVAAAMRRIFARPGPKRSTKRHFLSQGDLVNYLIFGDEVKQSNWMKFSGNAKRSH